MTDRINLSGESLQVFTRDRTRSITINLPYQQNNSITVVPETITTDSDGKLIGEPQPKGVYVINEPQTDDEKNRIVYVFDRLGNPITQPITINPQMTLQQVMGLMDMFVSTAIINDLIATGKLK